MFSLNKREQRLLRLTKICLVIQGNFCLDKAFKAISAVCLQKFFTLLGHMTNFVYKNNDTNYARQFMP